VAPASGPRRYRHSVAAFLSGAVFAPILILIASRLFPGALADSYGNIVFWSATFAGSLLSALCVWPFRRLGLWVAGLIGIFFVVLVMVTIMILAIAPGFV